MINIIEKRTKDDEEALKEFLEALAEAGHQHLLKKLGQATSPGKKIF